MNFGSLNWWFCEHLSHNLCTVTNCAKSQLCCAVISSQASQSHSTTVDASRLLSEEFLPSCVPLLSSLEQQLCFTLIFGPTVVFHYYPRTSLSEAFFKFRALFVSPPIIAPSLGHRDVDEMCDLKNRGPRKDNGLGNKDCTICHSQRKKRYPGTCCYAQICNVWKSCVRWKKSDLEHAGTCRLLVTFGSLTIDWSSSHKEQLWYLLFTQLRLLRYSSTSICAQVDKTSRCPICRERCLVN